MLKTGGLPAGSACPKSIFARLEDGKASPAVTVSPLAKPQSPADSAPPATLSNFRSRRFMIQAKIAKSDFCSGKWFPRHENRPAPTYTPPGMIKARKGFRPPAFSGVFDSPNRRLIRRFSGMQTRAANAKTARKRGQKRLALPAVRLPGPAEYKCGCQATNLAKRRRFPVSCIYGSSLVCSPIPCLTAGFLHYGGPQRLPICQGPTEKPSVPAD